MAQDLRTLDAAYWQPQVGVLGGVVTDLDDINQCILTILLTPKGSDPLRPDFALNIFDYVDKPINAIRAPLVRDVLDALERWEKRIQVTKVALDPQDDLAGWILSISWILSGDSNAEFIATTRFALASGDVTADGTQPATRSWLEITAIDGGAI